MQMQRKQQPLPRPPSSAGFSDLPVACINGVRIQMITHGLPQTVINQKGPAIRYEYGTIEVDHHAVRIIPLNPALANAISPQKPASHVDARLPPISGFRRTSVTGAVPPSSVPNLQSASSASSQPYAHIEIPFTAIEEEDHAWAEDGEYPQDRVSFWVRSGQYPVEYILSFNAFIAPEVEVPLLEGLLKLRRRQLENGDDEDDEAGVPHQLRAAQSEFRRSLVAATEAALDEAQRRRNQARIKRARSRRFSAPG
eukprot:tig00000219_g19502.t1